MNEEFLRQYNAVRNGGAGVFEFPSRGLIEVSGAEAVQFLNGLITNDAKKLEDNCWMRAAFPNAQGRLLAMVRVLQRGNKFLFDVDAANYASILQNLMRFTFAGDFKVADLSSELSLISIQGARAAAILAESKVQTPKSKSEIAQTELNGNQIVVIESTHLSPHGFDLFVPQNLAAKLIAGFETFGAVKVGDDARETLRVEMGTQIYGVDVDDTTVVLETGLDDAVSFQKGCYIGQEIIARIHFRGHVAKKLTGLIAEETTKIAAGDQLKSVLGKAAGRITSTVYSPKLNKQIALALVRYEFLQPETDLSVTNGENQILAKVVELPFIR